MTDSARWCEVCQKWGDHHTDRCPEGSIQGLSDQQIMAWGMTLGVLLDGALAAREKGFDVEVDVHHSSDGFYADFVDVRLHGHVLRLRLEHTINEDVRIAAEDLVALAAELRP